MGKAGERLKEGLFLLSGMTIPANCVGGVGGQMEEEEKVQKVDDDICFPFFYASSPQKKN